MLNKIMWVRLCVRRCCLWALDVLFPVTCVGCGTEDIWVCEQCARTVSVPTVLTCFLCERPSFDGCFCFECSRGRSLKGVWFVTHYHNPVVRLLIHALKYKGAYTCVRAVAPWIRHVVRQWPFLFAGPVCYVPIPLHASKERNRGFNQSHLLVAELLRVTGNGVCGCWLVSRTRATVPQVTLSKDARQNNVRDAFAYRGPRDGMLTQRIVLVDDVSTTGATLDSAGHVFREKGWNDVWGFVLAKG